MRDLDTIKMQRIEIQTRMAQAIRDENAEAFAQSMEDFGKLVADDVRADFEVLQNTNDTQVLTSRGYRVLTSDENKYYAEAIEAMKSSNPKQALTNINKTIPETVIDDVFDNIRQAHPLLDAIDFRNTGALIDYVASTTGGTAAWGEICKEITEELSADFTVMNLGLYSLTAFLPVCRAMLDLGPVWLDRYVREVLGEAIANALEDAVIYGDGSKKPIGMAKKLTGAIDSVHSDKTPVVVTELGPKTYGGILATLSKGNNNKYRAIREVAFICNPADYFGKVMPATTIRGDDGAYVNDVFPFPTRVFMAPACPSGKAIVGLPEKYLLCMGTQKDGKIEYSDEYEFLKQLRTYAVVLRGCGKAKDENAFVLLDISGLLPAVKAVSVSGKVDTTPAK